MRRRTLLAILVASTVLLTMPRPVQAGPAAGTRLDILNEEIARNPGDQRLYLRRALLYSDSGEGARALADVATARTVGEPVEAALVHGILLYRDADYRGAEQQFDHYLAAHPQHRLALEYRARLLRETGRPKAALADYQRLIGLYPDVDPGTYLSAAALMADPPVSDVEGALALLDRRMEDTGVIPQLQRRAIRLERERGDYDAAIQRLATLDEKTRATPEWHLEMAELLILSGDGVGAAPHLQIAEEQLQVRRQTPARAQLWQRLRTLQAEAVP